MNHYLVYHNPDTMGYPASEIIKFSVVSDKPGGPDLQGSTIWLITGEGTPRKYYLVQRFTADVIESGEDEGFATKISSETGERFSPMRRLDEEEWFRDFQRSRGNFSLGLQPIRDERFITGLEDVASSAATQ
jgi:hypothetical protein